MQWRQTTSLQRPHTQQHKNSMKSAEDRTNYDDLLGNWESHGDTRLQLLLAAPINRAVRLERTVNVTMNIFHKPVKLEGGRVDYCGTQFYLVSWTLTRHQNGVNHPSTTTYLVHWSIGYVMIWGPVGSVGRGGGETKMKGSHT